MTTSDSPHMAALNDVTRRKFYHLNQGMTDLITDVNTLRANYVEEGKIEAKSPADLLVREVSKMMQELINESKAIRPQGGPPPRTGSVEQDAERKGPTENELFS